ncbi:acyl-CoA dehydrogenase family protein [Streptomyces tropicalis]|uniref:Acyl-CoA dehydrogenase family protein n=1 Tax=Streptomyces tropicalis TaxID=3034234 RepID=A0ABT6A2I4_9ACTN|nr:acyl-CoA dehydrogenase family protein [Streptomyces tropicalis]MDF3298847.1 acyl-CoA dehydrogenase family protein [Streptomyces tropicalis]
MSRAATEAVAVPGDFWQRVAHEVADDLAVDAPERDRAGKPPYDEVARLREAGLPSVLAPPGADGAGTDCEAACAVVRRIAAADGSMGELLGRHYALSWSARFFGTPEQATAIEARAVRDGWLWAGGTGVPPQPPVGRPGGGRPSLVLGPAAEGHLLTGRRTLAAAVAVADRFVLDAVCATTGESLVVLVDPGHPGVTRDLLPDRLGQRLAAAGTVHFDDVPVGPGDVLGPVPHDEDGAAPFAAAAPLTLRLVLAHVVLGIAEGALAEARDLSRAAVHTRHADGGAHGFAPVPGTDADLLLGFGELALAAHGAAAVADRATAAMARTLRAGHDLDAERCADTAALVAAAEAATVRAALLIGERVLELADGDGLDRFWRNVRTLSGRGSTGPTLRAIGDHFLNSVRADPGRWG